MGILTTPACTVLQCYTYVVLADLVEHIPQAGGGDAAQRKNFHTAKLLHKVCFLV